MRVKVKVEGMTEKLEILRVCTNCGIGAKISLHCFFWTSPPDSTAFIAYA